MTDTPSPELSEETLSPVEATPPKRRRRLWLWILGGIGVVAVMFAFFIASVELLHYTESAAFCSACHVMHPEFTAYENSPHARAECGTCHIGPGAMEAFKAKLANVRYLWVYPTGQYEKPIPSPIHSLRPVEVVCEQCHWPEKVYDDRLVVVSDYAADEENSLTTTSLLMKTGGGTEEAGMGRGIHWHIENPVYYIATDEKRQDIPWVKAEYDGKVTEYMSVSNPLTQEQIDSAEIRKMDCVDCHNRASHNFRRPNDAIDESISAGLIASDLPYIKQTGVEVLETVYETEDAAAAAIAGIPDFYKETYPDVYAERQSDIEQATTELQAIFDRTTFPFMNVTWESHTNNIGHKDFPGCFRCHDGQHLSEDNEAIRLECNICHAIPQVALPGQPAPVISTLPAGNEPESHHSTTWLAEHRYRFDATCTECHTTDDPGGTSNTSFCSNSACHGTEWKFAGLNAPGIRDLVAPPAEPGNGTPNPIPHPIGADTDCKVCHGPDGVHPFPAGHESFDVSMCVQCHTPTSTTGETGDVAQPTSEATATSGDVAPAGGPPAIPHSLDGRDNCLACHATGGLKPYPADHEGRTVDQCQMCHMPAAAESPTTAPEATAAPDATTAPEATATSQGATPEATATTAAPASGGIPAIPHPLEGRDDCVLCHGEGGVKPYPADHVGRTSDTCLQCHQPVAAGDSSATGGDTGSTASAPGIPHDITDLESQCLACHYTGSVKPFPSNHEGYSNEMCLSCHQPQS